MRDELRTGPELNPADRLETALAALKPVPSRIDRDRVMYRAGQMDAAVQRQSVSPRRWLWPAATMLSLCLAATFFGLYRSAASSPARRQIVYINRTVPAGPSAARKQAVVAQRPEPRNEQRPAVVEDREPGDTEPTSLVSTSARSRYPILLMNADRLPDSPSGGATRNSAGQSFGAMRQNLFPQTNRKPTSRSTFSFFGLR